MVERVLFVNPRPQTRLQRTAMALAQRGVRVWLAAKEILPFFEVDVFEEVIDYTRPRGRFNHLLNDWFGMERRSLLKAIARIKPDIVHCVVEPNREPALLVGRCPGPVIVDGQDFTGSTIGVETAHPRQVAFERRALEGAAGLLLKGPPEELGYFDDLGYRLTDHRMRWLDWCQTEWFAAPDDRLLLSEQDGETHLVYAGQVAQDDGQLHIHYVELAEWLDAQRIHLHVYPTFANVTASHRALHRECARFHLHEPTPFTQLVREMAVMDAALWIHPPNPGIPRAGGMKERYAMGNKLFSYAEAGLPVAVDARLPYGVQVAEELGLGFGVRYQDLRRDAGRIFDLGLLSEARARTLDGRTGAGNAARHVQALLDFYADAISRSGT